MRLSVSLFLARLVDHNVGPLSGLGKTIQTIAFLAHLYENGIKGPFLVVCPLSTLANWVTEFERFTPDVPVLLYHGSPAERAEKREQHLGLVPVNNRKGKLAASTKVKKDQLPVIITTYELVINDRAHLSKIAVCHCWPSRGINAADKQLPRSQFKYIVVDESHRLKNLNCKYVLALAMSSTSVGSD